MHYLIGIGRSPPALRTPVDKRYGDDASGSISWCADRVDLRVHRAAVNGSDWEGTYDIEASRGVQPLFFAGMSAGFSLYESGDRGRGGPGCCGEDHEHKAEPMC